MVIDQIIRILEVVSINLQENLSLIGGFLLILTILGASAAIVNKIKLYVATYALLIIFSFFIDYYLFQEGIIDLIVFISYLFLATIQLYRLKDLLRGIHNVTTNKENQIELFIERILPIYIVNVIEYFSKNTFLQISFSIVFTLYLYVYLSNYLIRKKYIRAYNFNNSAFRILNTNRGTTGRDMPLLYLIGNPLLSIYCSLSLLLKIQKSKINAGYFDTRSRITHITKNSDYIFQVILLSICSTILVCTKFSVDGIYYSILAIYIWPLLKWRSNILSSYFTVVVGESKGERSMYDGIQQRVLPIHKKNISKLLLKSSGPTYSILFHNYNVIYDRARGFTRFDELLKSCNHLIIIFHTTNNPINVKCEYDFYLALRNPLTIIDTWEGNISVSYYDADVDVEEVSEISYQWLWRRISLIQKISDESFNSITGSYSDKFELNGTQRKIADNLLLQNNIINSSSFESLRINLNLIHFEFSKNDLDRAKILSGNGIYELNTLFRQLHESPSIPSRFIDLLNIGECIIRYLCGFCFSINVKSGSSLQYNVLFDFKAITYGSCTDFMSRWLKTAKHTDSKFALRISEYLNTKYMDEETVEKLTSYIRNLNMTTSHKISKNPTILELNWLLVMIRNKTRGHGTPSKVDYNFYITLEKVILFLTAEIANAGIQPCYLFYYDGYDWTMDLSKGGYPAVLPIVDNHEKGIHTNPLISDDSFSSAVSNHLQIRDVICENKNTLYIKLQCDNELEWWKCNDYFKINNGILYLLNQRTEKNESWISFSTGKLLRPEISKL